MNARRVASAYLFPQGGRAGPCYSPPRQIRTVLSPELEMIREPSALIATPDSR